MALLEKIDQLIGQAEGEKVAASNESGVSDDEAGEDPDKTSNIHNETAIETKEPQGPIAEPKMEESESSPKTAAVSLTVAMGDFPELVPGGTVNVSQAKGSWSSGEITFIGDVVEQMMDDVMELMD